jgi:hypothetical protein
MRNYSVSAAAARPRVPAAPWVGASRERGRRASGGGRELSVRGADQRSSARESRRRGRPIGAVGRRVRRLWRTRDDRVLHHRLRDRARRAARLAHRRDRGDAIHPGLAGTGELRMEDGSKHKVGPGSVSSRRRCGTISPALRRCARSPSSRRRCSRSSSTTSCCRRTYTCSAPRTAPASSGVAAPPQGVASNLSICWQNMHSVGADRAPPDGACPQAWRPHGRDRAFGLNEDDRRPRPLFRSRR